MGRLTIIEPTWPAPPSIKAFSTTRLGGCSLGPYASLNLGTHVDDQLTLVQQNREILQQELALPSAPVWLDQIHGISVVNLDDPAHPPTADGSYTRQLAQVCAVLTADCLPVLLCNRQGSEVAAVHVGWRGCLAGILANAVTSFNAPPTDLLAWLGPAIGPEIFEVGPEVFEAFVEKNSTMASAFEPRPNQKYHANLYQLATLSLAQDGVNAVFGGEYCTYSDEKRFFSYRRQGGITGRMATLIYIS